MHREEVILEEAGGILCDYRGHPIKNQLITNLVVGKEKHCSQSDVSMY